MKRAWRIGVRVLAWAVALSCAVWAFGALWHDFPVLKDVVAWGFVIATTAAAFFVRGKWRRLGVVFLAFALVLAWWLTLRPSNDRIWQADVARVAWAEVKGDEVTLHNVRNCDYRTETDYTARWETRTVRLSQITGIDLAITYWGSPWMAHPIVSFQFADSPPVCFSIEARKQVGQTYSAIGGLYRRFELIYIVADESDVVRLRSNYRKGEDVYLYRTTLTPDQARARFEEYLASLNQLHERARWYHAITTNCTTSIRAQRPADERAPWDWRFLINGKADEMMFEDHVLAAAGLPFDELKRRALINRQAQASHDASDFSRIIREGRPGM